MKVSLLQCNTYNLLEVKEKIRQSLDLIDGWKAIMPNTRIFIKLNAVGPFEPDKAITTHPVFVQAVIQLVKEITPHILVGDNPAVRDIVPTLKKMGVYDVLIAEDIPIVNGKESITIHYNDHKIYQSFDVSKVMVDVDVLINLPKLKTHALMYMTVAQKNLFGIVYGLDKAGWHVRASNPLEFGQALCDLYGAILDTYKDKKMIHICDGIVGLEGDGPSSGGIAKPTGAILASLDAISLDRIAIEVAGLKHSLAFLTQIAHERNLGNGDIKKIEIVGDDLSLFSHISYLPPSDTVNTIGLRLLKVRGLRNIILEHPRFNPNICISCGECVKICPPKALTMKSKETPKIKKSKCIRCWCCSEVCPVNAISKTKRPLIGRIVLRNEQ